jgi:hypothetical protein
VKIDTENVEMHVSICAPAKKMLILMLFVLTSKNTVTITLLFREVPGSNLGQQNGYADDCND